ncbi:glycosyl transferase family 21-domain-containing protein [Obelidium mucronatum]|nr:glycosyl transferase family 21-domain-containing protein [Obelidium mucronatum]
MITLYSVFAVAGMALWLFMFVLGIVSTLICYYRYNHKPAIETCLLSDEDSPGVSILRPLKGVDANLRDNLTSSFLLLYPKFEILFSVANNLDPAADVVRDLISEFPNVDAKLVVGESYAGVNPKVNNMVKSYSQSKYEIVWIMDSNVAVTPHTLTRAVHHLLESNVGLIHHLPIGVLPKSLGASVEQIYLNTSHVKMYTIISMLISCVIGKSNMFRKCELERVGGLAHFGKFMSEDNLIGRTIWNNGKLHVVPGDVVYQSLGNEGVSHFFKRKARWTRIRKFTDLDGVIVEPFIECFVNGIWGGYAFSYLFGIAWHWFFIGHVVYWFSLDMVLSYSVDSRMFRENFPKFVAAWFIREATALPLHLYAVAGSRVEWRGAPYRLQPGGTVIPEDEFVGVVKSIRIAGSLIANALTSQNHSVVSKMRICALSISGAALFGLAVGLELFFGGSSDAAAELAPVRINVFKKDSLDRPGSIGRECYSRARKDSALELMEETGKKNATKKKLWVYMAQFITGTPFDGPLTAADVWKVMFERFVEG